MAFMRALLPVALVLFALAACSSDSEGGEPAPDADALADWAEGIPECAEVWVAGAMMPVEYDGCMADGTLVAAAAFTCSDGSALVTYADRFYAQPGGIVLDVGEGVEQAASPDYKAAYDRCRP